MPVDDELRASFTDADGVSAVDLVDREDEQRKRYGRVILRRVAKSDV